MKAIVLAGGFAKRLWPLTKDFPKPLLQVGSKPLLQRIIEKMSEVEEIDEVIISSNKKFGSHYKEFIDSIDCSKKISLIVEDSMSESQKLGAVHALHYLMEKIGSQHEVLVVAGDNLFEFDLKSFIDFYRAKNKGVVAVHDIKEKSKAVNFGVVKMDGTKMIKLTEKPDNPESSLISTACYILTKDCLNHLKDYTKNDNPRDAIGHFIGYLVEKDAIHGYVFHEPWFDIGNLEEYQGVHKLYSEKG